jgi:8-oxo-dGTP pyrophosphatase MutT (NUDIX family)
VKEKILSLLFLRRDDEILLGMKKVGFGQDRWNGVGGKVEPGEAVEAAMIRESQEEIGVTPTRYEQVAELLFDEYFNGEHVLMHVHAFIATDWTGRPTESNEMAPRWFKINNIPYDDMWSDDLYWLPQVLAGKKVSADFKLDESDAIISHTITEVGGFKE